MDQFMKEAISNFMEEQKKKMESIEKENQILKEENNQIIEHQIKMREKIQQVFKNQRILSEQQSSIEKDLSENIQEKTESLEKLLMRLIEE